LKEIFLDDISYSVQRHGNKIYLIRNISFKMTQGDVWGILGPSGAGKTMLILLICGLLNPDQGKILVDGLHLSEQKNGWRSFRSKMGIVFQFPEDMFFHETVAEEFLKLLEIRGYSTEDAKRLAHEALEWAGLDPHSLWSRHPLHLSHGQLRLLSLALVWGQDWDLLVLDEPTIGLDSISKQRMLKEMVHRCHHEGKMGIIASHDTDTLLPLIDHALILQEGRCLIQDTSDDILSNPASLTAIGLSIPPLAELSFKLRNSGVPVRHIWRDLDQAARDIMGRIPV